MLDYMLRRHKNNAASQFSIDPGAFRTRFYSATHGLLFEQPSIATLDMDHPLGGARAVSQFGEQAEDLICSELEGLRAVSPVQSDGLNNLGLQAKMLSHFLKAARRSGITTRSAEVSLMLPHNGNIKVEAQLRRACRTGGARHVDVVHPALAAFYALELNHSAPSIMIDFGATGTRLFAIANSKIAHYCHLHGSGDDLDAAIAEGMMQRFSLLISPTVAREIKHNIAAATPQSFVQCTRGSRQIECLSVNTKTTTQFRVNSETVNQLLQHSLLRLAQSIRIAFSEIDNHIKDAAYETGIYICGGGALLPRMDQLVMSATDLPVEVVNRPMTSNVRGAAAIQAAIEPDFLQPELIAAYS